MSSWGIGPKFAFFTLLYSLFIVVLHLHYGVKLRMDFIPYWILAIVGVVLIVTGMIFLMAARKKIKRTFSTGELCTSGVYSICRHPVYASWVIFIVPGIVILNNSWAGLTIPLVMYVILKILVSKEERYLDQKFGDEFRSYKKKSQQYFHLVGSCGNKTESIPCYFKYKPGIIRLILPYQ